MRKITEEASEAFRTGSEFQKSNTLVIREINSVRLELFGYMIAFEDPYDGVFIGLSGWNTHTTRERLNGLLETLQVSFRIKCIKGEAWAVSLKKPSTQWNTAKLSGTPNYPILRYWMDDETFYSIKDMEQRFEAMLEGAPLLKVDQRHIKVGNYLGDTYA